MTLSYSDELLIMRGGFMVSASIVVGLLDLERRGVHFDLRPDRSLAVGPGAVLTRDDRVWLEQHALQVKEAILYIDQAVEQSRAGSGPGASSAGPARIAHALLA